ncbi:MAG: hypothetical protein M1826_006830 [Phylliscum demangeonii]|nr:MAG: hypothetical protein M1826_006830 [Phylliscum demangeonii]
MDSYQYDDEEIALPVDWSIDWQKLADDCPFNEVDFQKMVRESYSDFDSVQPYTPTPAQAPTQLLALPLSPATVPPQGNVPELRTDNRAVLADVVGTVMNPAVALDGPGMQGSSVG